MSFWNVATTVLGVAVIWFVVADAVQVMLGIRPERRRGAPSIVAYRAASRALRRVVARMSPERSERILGWFAPISILVLLVVWFAGLSLGFALIWTALPGAFDDPLRFPEAFYFSGVTFLTIGFGDVVPTSDWARFLAVAEGLMGVVLVALVLGFLSTLYSGYLDRERQVVTLDLPGVDRIQPIELVAHQLRGAAGDERLRSFFAEWTTWAASIITWHTTFPLLALFRSQHPGQSWITGLGLVTDAAVVALVAHDGDHPEAEAMYRMGARAILIHADDRAVIDDTPRITRDMWHEGHALARTLDVDLGNPEDSYDVMTELRAPYVGTLEWLIDGLAAPRGFWSTSAATKPRHRR